MAIVSGSDPPDGGSGVLPRLNGAGVLERPSGFKFLGPDEIFAPLSPIKLIVPKLFIAPGAPTMIAGYGYSGKSVVVQSLALAVASGRHLWGEHAVMRGPVCHLDYEQGQRLTRDRYQRLAKHMGIDPRELDGYLDVSCLPSVHLASEASVDVLCRLGENRAMCIIDSWRAAHPKVDENSSDVRPTLDRMGVASEKTGCAYVPLHHARKPEKGTAVGKFEIRGSSGFFDGCQTIYVLDGTVIGAPVVHLMKERMTGAKVEPFRLLIEDVERGGLSVRVDPSGTREAHRDLATEALGVVLNFPGATTESLRRELKCKKATLVAALSSLLGAGQLRRDEKGLWHPPTMRDNDEVPF